MTRSSPSRALLSLAPVLLHLACAVSVTAQRHVEMYLTAKGQTERLAKIETAEISDPGIYRETEQRVFVDPSKRFQSIVGIGGALTDAAAETFAKLPPEKQRELITRYFDPVDGIGYSLARTHINSCDFSSASYAYAPDGDIGLKSFSVAPDEKARIPLIKAALAAARGKLTVYVSPWSPPAWMKDNKDMLHGGKLLPEMRDVWARYFVAFIRAYEERGIPMWGLTVQNEPLAVQKWESCVYTAEEEKNFVRDHLGPVLRQAGLGEKKIIIWDHNRTWMFPRAQAAFDDPEAAKYIWGVGFHWYVDDSFENVQRVKETYPQAHLLFTEACHYPFNHAKLGEWQWGEKYATAMIHDFNNGAEGWTDWNILLDERGGPNHVGNFCYAPVHAETSTGELVYLNSFHYLGHFSKFVRPGAKRVAAASTIDRLQTTAFANPDGSVAVIVLNTSEEAQPFRLTIGGGSAPVKSPAHSILTLVVR